MEEKVFNFGEKTEEYPFGYGYCQCGCGLLAPKLTNGTYLYFISTHHPNNERGKLKIRMAKMTIKHRRKKKPIWEFAPKRDKWASKYDKCIGCGTITIPHWARGYCNSCYSKFIIRKSGDFNRKDKHFYDNFMRGIKTKISETQKIRKHLPVKISKILTKNKLKSLYSEELKSLQDIANMFNCSRAYIFNLCKKRSIRIRNKSEARQNASLQDKGIHWHFVDENFFKKWNSEMAYVLGFIYADGYVRHNLTSVEIAQKEIEILEKIKRLMKSEQNIRIYKHQELYRFLIGNQKIVKDLLRLGVVPKKSLVIKFPKIPEEFVSHFIRGYFDGDGSISFNKNIYGGNWRVSFTTGSSEFIKDIKENMEKLCLVSNQKIYKHKTANAFNLYYHSKDDINKIFRFFYDPYTVNNELYLSRKYARFLEALKFFDNRQN